MNHVWVIRFETNNPGEGKQAREDYSFVRVFDSFEKSKIELKNLLKTLGEKENEFFDGSGELNYLREWVDSDIADEKEYGFDEIEEDIELYNKTVEIMTHMFRGEELSEECLNAIRNKIEREKGCRSLGFNRDNENGSKWFEDTDFIAEQDGKSDGMFDVDYATTESGTQEEGYLFMRTNAFLIDDPDRDYYCYVRQSDWSVKDGLYFHVELQKHEVE